MKIALFIVSVALVIVSIILGIKSRKWAGKQPQKVKSEITPGDMPLDKSVLIELGFKIYDTKDQIYALHPNGISMTWIENQKWTVVSTDGNIGWSDNVYTVGELVKFAMKHGKEIQVTDKN